VCCVLHNFLRGIDPNDQIMREVDQEFSHDVQRPLLSRRKEWEENLAWKTKRDTIANAMWQDYEAHRAVLCSLRSVIRFSFSSFMVNVSLLLVVNVLFYG